ARTLEAHRPGGRPGNRVALRVGDQDLGVVEAGAHMRDAGRDVLAFLALQALLVTCHVPASLLLLAGDRLRRALAGTGVGMGALATYRRVAALAKASVATKIHAPLDVHLHLAAEVALDLVVVVDIFANTQHLGVGEFVHPPALVDPDRIADLSSGRPTDAVNIGKGDHRPLVGGDVHPGYARHVIRSVFLAMQARSKHSP